MSAETTLLPVVARLYTTGVGRRYRRASTQPGPGEALCLVANAEVAINMAVSAETLRCMAQAESEAQRLALAGQIAEAAALRGLVMLLKGTLPR